MSPVTQYVYDGKKWRNEVMVSRASVSNTTLSYPPVYGAVGTYRPSASTTGVPEGTQLTRYPASGSADYEVTTPGAVLDRLDIHGRVIIKAADVTISRCVIRGKAVSTSPSNTACIVATAAACQRLVVQDSMIKPEFPSLWVNGINGHDFTLLRCDISQVVDGAGLYNTFAPGTDLRVKIQSSYIHDLAYYSPDPNHSDNQTHNDGIQVQGGLGAVIQGNNIQSFRVGTTTVVLSCMLFNDNVGRCGNHVIEDNWFGGGYVPINALDSSLGTSNLGRFWRNKFDGTSYKRLTVRRLASVVWDFGIGTVNQNTYVDTGRTISVIA